MLDRLTVKQRLGMGFSLTLVLVLALGGVSLYFMQELSSLTAKLYRHPYAVSTAMLRIDGNIVKIHRAMKDVALATSPADMDKAMAKVTDLEAAVYKDFEIVGERFLGDKGNVNKARKLFADWKPIRDEVVAFMKQGKRDEAAAVTTGKGATHVAELNDSIGGFIEFAEGKASGFTEGAKANGDSAFTFIIAMLAVIILVSLGVAILVTRGILRQLGADPKEVSAVTDQIAAGHLAVTFNSANGEIVGLYKTIRDMSDNLKDVISRVRNASGNVAAGSDELASTSQMLSQGATEQAASIEEVSASMDQMVSNIKQNAENAQQTKSSAQQAAADIKEGGNSVRETVAAMNEIADKISIIEEIARQTNLLALNAAIEAARAGEHGKGFAVVAAEVRKLAERSGLAASEISELSARSVGVAEKAGSMLETIVPNIQRTAELVQEISVASSEQNAGADQINRAIQQLDSIIQQNASSSEEMASTASQLSSQSKLLLDTVAYFNTGDQGRYIGQHQSVKTTVRPAPTKPRALPHSPRSSGVSLDMTDDDRFERF